MQQILLALVALVITVTLAAPVIRLSLLPVDTQVQKNNYTIAETMAILIRKRVVQENTVFVDDSNITQGTVFSGGFTTGQSQCSIKNILIDGAGYTPRRSDATFPAAVECTVGQGKNAAVVWQPLYTAKSLTENTAANRELTIDDFPAVAELCFKSLFTTTYTSSPGSTARFCGLAANDPNKDYDNKNQRIPERITFERIPKSQSTYTNWRLLEVDFNG